MSEALYASETEEVKHSFSGHKEIASGQVTAGWSTPAALCGLSIFRLKALANTAKKKTRDENHYRLLLYVQILCM